MSEIDDYIRANRDRYTREAITQQLVDAGHDRAAVDAAWEHADSTPASSAGPAAWQPSGRSLLVLVVLGIVAAAVAYGGEPYGAGVIAPVVYAVLAAITVGSGFLIARMTRDGRGRIAGWILGVAAMGLAALLWWLRMPVLALSLLALLGLGAVVLVRSGPTAGRLTVMLVSWVPVAFWLVLTGVCIAPQIGKGLATT